MAEMVHSYADLIWSNQITRIDISKHMDPPEPWGMEVVTIRIEVLPNLLEKTVGADGVTPPSV